MSGDYIISGAHLNSYYSNGALCYAYGIYDFANADQYAAVKFKSGGGVRLGWIKVYVADFGGSIKVTVRSYAYTDSVFVSVPESQGNDVSAKIFPNPFTEQSLLVVEGGMKELRDVVLRDAYGRAYRVNYEITQSGILLNRENFPSGVYFLCFTTEKGRGRVKIVAR